MLVASDGRSECSSCSRISGRLARLGTFETGVALLVALEASRGSFPVPVLLAVRETSTLLWGTKPTLACPGVCKSRSHSPPDFFVVMKRSHWKDAYDNRIVSHEAPRFMLYYHCERDISWSVFFSAREVNIAVLDRCGFQTSFGSAASAFENIELPYIHCALKENFSVTLKGFTCVSLICWELLVRSVATTNTNKEWDSATDKVH